MQQFQAVVPRTKIVVHAACRTAASHHEVCATLAKLHAPRRSSEHATTRKKNGELDIHHNKHLAVQLLTIPKGRRRRPCQPFLFV